MSKKKNEGVLFPTEIRVVGSYTDRPLIPILIFSSFSVVQQTQFFGIF